MALPLSDRFMEELRTILAGSVDELTPSAIARAVVAALDVDGAGITLIDTRLRLPLGASDPISAAAEQQQATLGEGPCLEAARDGRPRLVGEATLRKDWPVYYRAMRRHTPFRSVAAIPLSDESGAFAALNLYHADANPALPSLGLIRFAIGEPTAALLTGIIEDLGQLELWVGERLNDQLRSTSPGDRLEVWTAVGIVMEAAGVDDGDALALLRGYAFSHDLTLDVVGRRMARHELTSREVLEQP
jgi:GAF domain-containing protein